MPKLLWLKLLDICCNSYHKTLVYPSHCCCSLIPLHQWGLLLTWLLALAEHITHTAGQRFRELLLWCGYCLVFNALGLTNDPDGGSAYDFGLAESGVLRLKTHLETPISLIDMLPTIVHVHLSLNKVVLLRRFLDRPINKITRNNYMCTTYPINGCDDMLNCDDAND